METCLLLHVLTMCIVVANGFLFSGNTVNVVTKLDVTKYMGRWYQTHASPFVMETFEKDAVCVTADYSIYNASTINVYNANRDKTPNGPLKDIRGFGFLNKEVGKLSVRLGGTFFDANYWVLKLGPINNQGLYDYSIVSEPLKLALFVLTRDVETFRAKYQDEVLAYLRANGFGSFLNRPIKTYQEKDCKYAPKPQF